MNVLTRILVVSIVALTFLPQSTTAQNVAVKTNALYGVAALTPNAGIETRIAKKWTGELSIGYNPFPLKDNENTTTKWRHVLVQPELRYWLCSPFAGHFFGAHLLYSHFNAGNVKLPFGIFSTLDDYRLQGDMGGAGVSYGYNHMLSKTWSLEFEVGLGIIIAHYRKYNCQHCGSLVDERTKTYVMPTKLAINAVKYF